MFLGVFDYNVTVRVVFRIMPRQLIVKRERSSSTRLSCELHKATTVHTYMVHKPHKLGSNSKSYSRIAYNYNWESL